MDRSTLDPLFAAAADFDWPGLWQFLQFALTTVIGYLMWRYRLEVGEAALAANHAVRLGQANSQKLDTVTDQTSGMSQHLASLQKTVSHAAGVADERADLAMFEARSTPPGSREKSEVIEA